MSSDQVTGSGSISREMSLLPPIRHNVEVDLGRCDCAESAANSSGRSRLPRTLQPCLSPPSSEASQAQGQQGDGRYPESCNPNRVRLPLTAEQQQLATRYLPLARSMAARLAGELSCVKEDFEAAACLALVEAAQGFEIERQLDFVTYARPHILGALYDLRREMYVSGCRIKHACRQMPEFVRLVPDLEERHRIVDGEREEPIGALVESRDLIETWIKHLPRRHAEAIRQIYIDGQSLQETARRFGCSASLMSRLHQEALAMLTEELEKLKIA